MIDHRLEEFFSNGCWKGEGYMTDHRLEELISSRNEFVGIDIISHFFSKWYQILVGAQGV